MCIHTYARIGNYVKTCVRLCLVIYGGDFRVREKDIEQKLVKVVKAKGGICPKFISPGFDGMPDRICLLPHGKFGFVEVKATGKKPRALQLVRHKLLRQLGFKIFILDSEEEIGMIIDEIEGVNNGI